MIDGAAPRPVTPLGEPIDAVIRVPGSKSLTNRALVCAALATGTSRIDGALIADDTEAMLDALGRLGIDVALEPSGGRMTVVGSAGELPEGPIELDARLSGTTARFLLPMLAIGPGPYLLDGADPLRRRPMADGLSAVATLGAVVVGRGEPGHLPVQIVGSLVSPVAALDVRGDASSQFLSGLLLAAPCRPAGLVLHVEGHLVSRPYVDLTLSVMRAFGAEVAWEDERTLRVAPTGYRGTDYTVEPDASAASYFFAAAAITGGRVRVEGLGAGALQGDVHFVDVLEQMGASVTREPDGIEVQGGELHGVDADFTDISDTAPTLAAVAVFAEGATTIGGIGFIRRKETDRIHAVVTELARCGIRVDELDDGWCIHPGLPTAAVVETYDDHRMAMSFALLGLRVPGIEIADPGVVDKTFPAFWEVFESLAGGGNSAPGKSVPGESVPGKSVSGKADE